MNESKLSLTTKVARVAMVLVALLAALAALQALSAQPAQALPPPGNPCPPGMVCPKAPFVTMTYPANNPATPIAPGANVTATFSAEMNASTINTTTFKLMNARTSTYVSATVSYDSGSRRATLNPSANLQSGINYVATVTPGAKGTSGISLDQNQYTTVAEPKTWTFTVGSRSQGVYRIPYQNDTTVKVFSDFEDHDPPGKVDLYATPVSDDASYRVVAAAAGVIRRIQDGYSATKGKDADPCDNNYVWIEHPNGEWTKYTHMSQGSVTKNARLSVGERVSAGQFLGFEDDVGCANGTHLHFEVAELIPTTAARTFSDTIDSEGFIRLDQARNLVPRMCGVLGEEFDTNASYTARSC
jgi:murein DD-endopeptidase MepM/ murein hydrolase activator NlpD